MASPANRLPGPVAFSSFTFIRLSFREGGVKEASFVMNYLLFSFELRYEVLNVGIFFNKASRLLLTDCTACY